MHARVNKWAVESTVWTEDNGVKCKVSSPAPDNICTPGHALVRCPWSSPYHVDFGS